MRMGLINKFRTVLKEKVLGHQPTAVKDEGPSTVRPRPRTENTAVIVKEGKRQVQIACWDCGRHLWVARGSMVHQIGLCGRCLRDYDTIRL